MYKMVKIGRPSNTKLYLNSNLKKKKRALSHRKSKRKGEVIDLTQTSNVVTRDQYNTNDNQVEVNNWSQCLILSER